MISFYIFFGSVLLAGIVTIIAAIICDVKKGRKRKNLKKIIEQYRDRRKQAEIYFPGPGYKKIDCEINTGYNDHTFVIFEGAWTEKNTGRHIEDCKDIHDHFFPTNAVYPDIESHIEHGYAHLHHADRMTRWLDSIYTNFSTKRNRKIEEQRKLDKKEDRRRRYLAQL